ncbi:MAG: hypothetical protein U0W24_07930 [Bacteroidales bacterium]
MKKLLLSSFLIVLALNDFAQNKTSFLPGYLIHLNGDTIKGFIEFKDWPKNPETITFKSQSGEKTIAYKPCDIKEFGVNNEKYQSHAVTIDNDPFRDDELPFSDKANYLTDTVFLQVLVEGPKSLYYLKDQNLKEHFFIYQDSTIKTLIYRRYKEHFKSATYYDDFTQNMKAPAVKIKIISLFRNQLTYYLNDCPEINPEIATLKYKRKDLTGIFKKYYKMTGKITNFQDKSNKAKPEFGVLAGATLTFPTFKSSSSAFDYLTKTSFPKSADFTAGVFLNFSFPRNHGRGSFNNELFYVSYESTGQYTHTENQNIYSVYSSKIGASYLKLNNFFRYKFPVKKSFFFLDGGISSGIELSETNELTIVDHVYSVENISEEKALKSTRKGEFGLLLGPGFLFKNISFCLKYELNGGLSNMNTPSSPVHRLYMIAAWKF